MDKYNLTVYENFYYKMIRCKNCKELRPLFQYVHGKEIYVFCRQCMIKINEEYKSVII